MSQTAYLYITPYGNDNTGKIYQQAQNFSSSLSTFKTPDAALSKVNNSNVKKIIITLQSGNSYYTSNQYGTIQINKDVIIQANNNNNTIAIYAQILIQGGSLTLNNVILMSNSNSIVFQGNTIAKLFINNSSLSTYGGSFIQGQSPSLSIVGAYNCQFIQYSGFLNNLYNQFISFQNISLTGTINQNNLPYVGMNNCQILASYPIATYNVYYNVNGIAKNNTFNIIDIGATNQYTGAEVNLLQPVSNFTFDNNQINVSGGVENINVLVSNGQGFNVNINNLTLNLIDIDANAVSYPSTYSNNITIKSTKTC